MRRELQRTPFGRAIASLAWLAVPAALSFALVGASFAEAPATEIASTTDVAYAGPPARANAATDANATAGTDETPATADARHAMKQLLQLALDQPHGTSLSTIEVPGKGTYLSTLVRGTVSSRELDELDVIVGTRFTDSCFTAAIPASQIAAFVDLPGLQLVTLGRTWHIAD
jgi:hypothetical protein